LVGLDAPGEPIFVLRSPATPEGDGWVIAMIYRGNENRSDFAVFKRSGYRSRTNRDRQDAATFSVRLSRELATSIVSGATSRIVGYRVIADLAS
jgi:Retinal pigment epithelial membrane protein